MSGNKNIVLVSGHDYNKELAFTAIKTETKPIPTCVTLYRGHLSLFGS